MSNYEYWEARAGRPTGGDSLGSVLGAQTYQQQEAERASRERIKSAQTKRAGSGRATRGNAGISAFGLFTTALALTSGGYVHSRLSNNDFGEGAAAGLATALLAVFACFLIRKLGDNFQSYAMAASLVAITFFIATAAVSPSFGGVMSSVVTAAFLPSSFLGKRVERISPRAAFAVELLTRIGIASSLAFFFVMAAAGCGLVPRDLALWISVAAAIGASAVWGRLYWRNAAY